jgi:hypothetical protein
MVNLLCRSANQLQASIAGHPSDRSNVGKRSKTGVLASNCAHPYLRQHCRRDRHGLVANPRAVECHLVGPERPEEKPLLEDTVLPSMCHFPRFGLARSRLDTLSNDEAALHVRGSSNFMSHG